MNKACFLDRDGVINEEVNYLHEPEKVALIAGTQEAIKLLSEHGFKRIVVTNQAGVAKGYFPEADIHRVHERIKELLAESDVTIDAFYHCPHHPEFTEPCNCRKPNPGMLLQAIADFNIDVTESFLIGEPPRANNPGRNANRKQVFLTRTGYGANIPADQIGDAQVVDTPLEAVKAFLNIK